MKNEGFERLHKQMKKSGVTKYIGKFKYKIECIYLFDTDTIPYELIFIRQKNKETLTLKIIVKRGYIIDDYQREEYYNIIRFFGIEKGNGKTFKPSDLFSALNIKLLELELSNLFQPKCYEIAKFHSDVEESEKIYFKRLLNNNLRKNSVTDRNFEKTSKLIGKEIAIDLKNKNISTCWTHIPNTKGIEDIKDEMNNGNIK